MRQLAYHFARVDFSTLVHLINQARAKYFNLKVVQNPCSRIDDIGWLLIFRASWSEFFKYCPIKFIYPVFVCSKPKSSIFIFVNAK